MPEPQFNFGNANFDGGQQIFGNENTVSQTNYAALSPREQVDSRLTTIRSEHPDPVLARREIAEIEQGLNEPTPENRNRLERALTRLAESTGDARTAAEAIAAISVIVAANWPF
ncbi:hypothetical protein AMIS_26790 [Actinoplanes missouriensis 431]|uniref:Uncharacterized protein n=1 Tax=Actinoplanes missouriensis (strain ATCC 14538 / DSM 43046 / CBS 188.64 / JCM 3121 / NBRC 102363 / NCIMB 12654 / NRRL B-3342 / UNCC 431) TaxID=512565 RepID=I0H4G2_ACTM4|nr:hypothetical protein [Actinoplanes missouriensis]BAL87899.1 hypothetical protein AMIS_26790 [Actinoplanes missouriensis 431]